MAVVGTYDNFNRYASCVNPGVNTETLAFDFEWMNKALFYGAYQRASSYFQNTDYAASGLPDARQQALLAPWRAAVTG